MKKNLLLILVALLPLVANADVKIGGIYYELDENSETARVVARNDGNSYAGVLVIPETVTYNSRVYTVTSIGGYAFFECRGLVSITIPNSIEKIDFYAFAYCI